MLLIFQDIKTLRFWRHFLTQAFAIVGLMATLMQTWNVIFPSSTIFQGEVIAWSFFAISVVGGVSLSWPRPIEQDYATPNTRISIVEGDILNDTSHLVIGTNDTFDTAIPNIIARGSLQGQALDRLYGGDVQRLDADISNALTGMQPIGTITKAGKTAKYGVGTVVALPLGTRKLFFLAYCEMNNNNNAGTTVDKIWTSLESLWVYISQSANGDTVSMPVIGGGLSRISSLLPAQDAIRLTILSFMFASRAQQICKELRIVVRPADYRKLDRLELQAFLSSLRAS